MDLKQQLKVNRYAQSLLTAANQSGRLQELFDELSQLITVIQDTQLDTVLSSDRFSREEKIGLVRQLGTSQTPELTSWLDDMIQADDLGILLLTLERTVTKISQMTKVFDVEVTTAHPLTEDQKEQLCQIIEARFGIMAHAIIETVDQGLIGGFVVTFDNQVIDASIRTQLQELRKKV